MTFVAKANIDKLSPTSIQITDNSNWGELTISAFSARTVTVTTIGSIAPDGISNPIDFPFINGYNDKLTIPLPSDMAVTIKVDYTPVVTSAGSVYSSTYTICFAGRMEEVFSARVLKSEVSGSVKPNILPRYREVTTTLLNLIEGADSKVMGGDLEAAQVILNKGSLIDIDTTNINV